MTINKCPFPPLLSKVYYPNLGWMCVDATDPEKGNWLRYVNWARSGKEQNLFPLEINRTIYYKTLKVLMPLCPSQFGGFNYWGFLFCFYFSSPFDIAFFNF